MDSAFAETDFIFISYCSDDRLMTDSTQQFVIQEHTTPDGMHWDLMLEMQDVLWTWRLDRVPGDINQVPVRAQRIFDHALRFLSYEGPVQNGTGRVSIFDKGAYQIIEHNETVLEIQLAGELLSGCYRLCLTEGTVRRIERGGC